MFLAEAGYLLMVFFLYISGVQGQQKTVCALKGSSVNLSCSAQCFTSSNKWYTLHRNGLTPVLKEVSADRKTYTMSEDGQTTLTIHDLRESDTQVYCCSDDTNKTQNCCEQAIRLQVTDLQVKVFPATEDQTVTLMCSTSCPLTETPAVYIWYKNREFLYEDQSPWYQELVSSEAGVRYSCAIKGYKDLRAPEVSVDSVTLTCFSVTYAKGRMCSSQQKSEDKPCSITYPREVYVQQTPASTGHFKLNCNSSCSLTDPQTAFRLYKNREHVTGQSSPVPSSSPAAFTCAVEGHEDLFSSEVCVSGTSCWSVNYVSRRICALAGSSVNISSEYLHPENEQPEFTLWYKKGSVKEEAEQLTHAADRVECRNNKSHHILSINKLKKDDSAEYTFRVKREKASVISGVTLVVTGLRVKFRPSSVVTEGQRVTVTCSTSCPLTYDTVYIWYFNGRPLNPTQTQKHLVLNPVSSEHAGNYSCGVQSHKNNKLAGKTLTVQSINTRSASVAAGVVPVLLVVMSVTIFLLVRRKTSQTSGAEASHNLEPNPGPVYEDISVQPTEEDDLYYSKVEFTQNHEDPLYSTITSQQDQLQEQLHVPYAVVHFTANKSSE